MHANCYIYPPIHPSTSAHIHTNNYLLGNGRTGRFALHRWIKIADPFEVENYLKLRKMKNKTAFHTNRNARVKTNIKPSDYELSLHVS